MKWIFVLGLVSVVTHAQVATGPTLVGTTTPINNGPGDQQDPHVSGEWVAYTSFNGNSAIRYHNLVTRADAQVPNNGDFDFLSDIGGDTLVFSRITPGKTAVYSFNARTAGLPEELDPQPGTNRILAAVGGNTVAWQDLGFSPSTTEAEIVVHDLSTGVTTRLSDDTDNDINPSVSPSGTVVVWSKCKATSGCDIVQATRSASGWTQQVITGPEGEDSLPDTNGDIVVYGSNRSGERDIFWKPVAGGAEQRLSLPGDDSNPNVSGRLIAFEHRDVSSGNSDIFVYDLLTRTLYQLTETALDEILNDVWISSSGDARVVWTVVDVDLNVEAFSFKMAPACNPKPTDCANPGDRPLLSSFTLTRNTGSPSSRTASFTAASGSGLLCIQNSKTTSGRVTLNGEHVVCPSAFNKNVKQIQRAVTIKSSNSLQASIAGSPGTSYTVNVYGVDPCAKSAGKLQQKLSDENAQTLIGREATVMDGLEHTFPLDTAEDEELSPQAAGCSSTSGTVALWMLAALGVAGLLPRTAKVRVRATRRRR